MSDFSGLFGRAALTLGLGLIIGFQRERKESTIAGIRTFPLFAFIGFFCALIEREGIPWLVAGGLLGLSGVLLRSTSPASGITTEMAAIFVYLIGAYLAVGNEIELVVVAVGVCALLLHLKATMHTWVGHLDSKEVRAIMQFVLLAFVILPLLPNHGHDKFQVLNPREIWMMVVLISGISVASFSALKILGPKLGSLWSGILGGFISSTATTLSVAKLSSRVASQKVLVPAILVASTAAFIRIFLEVLIVAPGALSIIILPLGSMFFFMLILSSFSYYSAEKDIPDSFTDFQNPSQIRAALLFGLIYAVILYTSALARHEYGDKGIFIVALLSGIVDVDAITISTARLLDRDMINQETGWKAILLALLSNLFFKGALVMLFANGKLKQLIIVYFSLSIIVGLLIFTFWS